MRRQVIALAAVLAATLALAGCDAIPDSGPVREGLPRLEQVERSVQFNPPGPVAGANQETIVRGFVRAASSSEKDYEIAREFLAPGYAEQWDPSLGVLVTEGAPQFQSSKEGSAVISLRVMASIDAEGTLTPAEPERQTDLPFELVRVGGEWRISSAPAGIILERSTFNAVWISRQVHYLSTDGRLVPEMRWFLNRSTLSTQIVREVLAGPSEAMTPALHTAAPSGTTLISGSVPIVDGTAMIDLSTEVFQADEAALEQLKRQLAASLRSVPGVTRFQLLVHGSAVDDVNAAIADEGSGSDAQFTAVLREGQFGMVTTGEVRPLEGIGERVVELAPSAVTVAVDRSAVAVRHQGGVSVVTESDTLEVDDRRGLLPPSLDALGYVWTYSHASPGELWATPASGEVEATVLSTPWLEGREVTAVRVSMGGNRVAALVENDGASEVLVAGIVRDEAGAPIGLTETATTQLWEQGAPIDFTWISDLRFAVLSESGLLGSSSRITVGEVGGFESDSGAVVGGAAIAGVSNHAYLRVLDDQRRLFKPQGNGWQQQLGEVELLAKVG